jgi:hypothetical protein
LADTATPAPVPAAEPTTIPASAAAILSGDTGSYREARRAERAGKPLNAVPAPTPAEPDATAAPAPHLSRRQQQINARAERAVDSATAALREENARLKADLDRAKATPAPQPAAPAPQPVAAQPAAPAAAAEPDWKRFARMPNAPKLADFDTVEEHTAAMSLFINDQRWEERQTADRQRTERDATDAAQRVQVEGFIKQLHDAKAADPTFADKLSLDVKTRLVPFSALRNPDGTSRQGGPINVIGEHVYASTMAAKVLMHFSEHPDELTRLTSLPPILAALPPSTERTRAHIAWMAREYGKLEGRLDTSALSAAPLTDVPAPIAQLGTRAGEAADPKAAAIRKGDTRAYREIRRQERAALRH